MPQKFTSGARSLLEEDITAISTSLLITLGGDLFPAANYEDEDPDLTPSQHSNEDWFKAVLQDDGGFEIIYVMMHEENSNVLYNIRRGQEGTEARAFNAGAIVGIRPTGKDMQDLVSKGISLDELKQPMLESGVNIKTVGGESIVGFGDVELTKEKVGLGNADDTADLDKPISTATQDALDTKQATLVSATNIKTVAGKTLLGSGNVVVTKSDVGLSLVDNTSDATKPVSAPQATAISTAVNNAISSLMGNAPVEALDTLRELGDALGNDPNFAGSVTLALTGKVDKVTGKSLTTNDFTTALKQKLDGIEAQANKYTLPNATNTVLGGVKNGTNIDVASGVISVKDASTTQKGVVQLNDTLTSTATNQALTAAKGKTLKDAHDTLNAALVALDNEVIKDTNVGKAANQVPTNQDLGKAAQMDVIGEVFMHRHNKQGEPGSVWFESINGVTSMMFSDPADAAKKNLFDILIRDHYRKSVEASSGGRQTVLYTAKGQPSIMNIIPVFKLEDIDPSLGTGPHPMFVVGGVTKRERFIGTYPGSVVNGELLSLPGVDPSASLNFDSFVSVARANGNGWGLMTNADWAGVAMWCWKNGFMPRGNTNHGCAHDAMYETGRRQDGALPGVTTGAPRTLTGSGPVSWRHDNTSSGIADLCGNVWEWVPGMRIVGDEIHIIANNDVALFTTDLSVGSTAWRAIDGATGELVAAGHTNAVKVAASGTANYTLVRETGASFEGITNPGTVPVAEGALQVLKSYGLFPLASNLGGDRFQYNLDGERIALRGGSLARGSASGVFALSISDIRSITSGTVGARSAFVTP